MKNKLIVVLRYNRDISWIKEYSNNILIYNTGEPLNNGYNYTIINMENLGNSTNPKHMLKFFVDNYDNLPICIAFLQDYPFDHCKKEVLDKLILNNCLTALEYYGPIPGNNWEKRAEDGGYIEKNDYAYIRANDHLYHHTCKYSEFDVFMNHYFENYLHLDWLRFAPGCQYIIEKKNVLQYPREFWNNLMNEINVFGSTEAFIIERALYYILKGVYKLR
jgi:hypothetical protein